MTGPELDDLLTIAEAAELAGRTEQAIRKAFQRGSLRGRKVGAAHRGVWVTTRVELDRYLAWSLRRHERRQRQVLVNDMPGPTSHPSD